MITAELVDKMKNLEIAEKLLARKHQIVEVQNSVSTLLDDFNKNWEIDGQQALRERMDILDKELSKQWEHELFKLKFLNKRFIKPVTIDNIHLLTPTRYPE